MDYNVLNQSLTTDLQVLSNIFKIYSLVPEQQIKLNENNEPSRWYSKSKGSAKRMKNIAEIKKK